jgi:hypothetical protein
VNRRIYDAVPSPSRLQGPPGQVVERWLSGLLQLDDETLSRAASSFVEIFGPQRLRAAFVSV